MNADRLLTEEEAKNIILKGWCSPETTAKDICLEPWIEEITEAQDAKTLKKILGRLEKANCEAVLGKRLAALEQALEELRAELDAAQKGKKEA